VLLAVANETRGWRNRGSSQVGVNSAREAEAVAVDADDAIMVVVDAECGIRVNATCNLCLGREGVG
jgi:hypothetical protein